MCQRSAARISGLWGVPLRDRVQAARENGGSAVFCSDNPHVEKKAAGLAAA
ncbi:hypothetical protein IE4803_CH02178 [Rhizobium etli bv. phaseoli str. IE4803]|nr:hypothetical protein IE4803_CH02178 [Rhizobium etli bv. phaseoli str. IE4803]